MLELFLQITSATACMYNLGMYEETLLNIQTWDGRKHYCFIQIRCGWVLTRLVNFSFLGCPGYIASMATAA
jgi:hypothetical protein